MAIKHNYLNTVGLKPIVSEIELSELVPNFADGRLWTKNTSGIVTEIGISSQNIDAGSSNTVYGGTIQIDCGGA